MSAGAQAPAAAPPPGDGFWPWLGAFLREPGVAESLLAAIVVAAVLGGWWRLSRLVRNVRSRDALADYLLGAEQALHGDLDGAHTRLTRVVRDDPENHYARLLLGKVLADRGEPELAHQQHVVLKSAFGVDTVENDLMLAHSLLAAGMPREAADAAERALVRAPDRAAGWQFVYRARLQTGDFDAARRAGRRLLALLPDGAERRQLAADVAQTVAQTGNARWWRGDAAGARALLLEAQRLDPSPDVVVLLAARLDAQRTGVPAAVQALLHDERTTPRALVAGSATRAVATTGGLPAATFAGLVAPGRWACAACQTPLPQPTAQCPRCHATRAAEPDEPRLVTDLASPLLTMDAIDVNDAHVQRLVVKCLDGTGEPRAAARAELLTLRERAVAAVLRAAWHTTGRGQDAAIDVLRAMGPQIAPALFAASDALGDERRVPIGERTPAALVGRVVQGFDRSALPHVEPLFASARPEHRKILIDYFVGLADVEQFQLVLERFPPVEILHRLNKAEAPVLQRFLQAVPRGHFVAEVLLREGTFYRDEDLLAAIAGAAQPDVLHGVFVARGPSRSATKVAIAALADPLLADVAERLLLDLGAGALGYVLAAFSDPEGHAGARPRLARVLEHGGEAAAAALCDSFGPEPSALDDELRALLVALGDTAVLPLQHAYARSGWLERVSAGLVSRHTNRRVQIVLALRTIGSARAAASLHALADRERDGNLRLRLHDALHDLGSRTRGGADGPAP